MNPQAVKRVIYPLHERLLKRPTFSYLTQLEASQWLPTTDVEKLQLGKCKALLRVAAAHCPWHKQRFDQAGLTLDTDQPLTMRQLRRLPTMDKADIQANREQMLWKRVPGGYYKYNTGGSSGDPVIFYYGRQRQASDAAGRIRARRWWGVDVGDREVYLWGAPVELAKTDRIKTLRDRLFNQLVLNAFEMSPANMDAYIDAIHAFRPKCIYGYASSIALLARHTRARATTLRLPELKVVCTTGEPLYANQRALIEEVFRAPAANEFGSRDIGFTAHETPQGQMLLMSESILLEILDSNGQPVAAGELGEAVMTGLCSQAQPFIRYRTGDIVRASDSQCEAGRGLQVIGEVVGRSTDFVTRADGTIMHALAVIYAVREVEGVKEFKFIQHSLEDVEVLVKTSGSWSEMTDRQIRRGLAARLGNTVRIRVRDVEHIPPEASGKHRQVVSHVPLPSCLSEATQPGA